MALSMANPRNTYRKGKFTKQIAGLSAALCLVASCSGVQHNIPKIGSADEQAALVEIEAFSTPGNTDVISEAAAERRLRDVFLKIKPSAIDVCRHVGENRACAWDVNYSDVREYNAFAMEGNRVVVYHGIIAATDNDDELAFILAHELSHHIANHIRETRKRANTGILIAGLAMAALSHGSYGCNTYACLNNLQNAAQASMHLGGTIGVLIFSVKQEKEADYLAAHILNSAGYDLAQSRTMLVKLGAKTDEKKTGFLNSHPAGPERLASYDKTIEVVQNDTDGLPGKEQFHAGKAHIESSPPTENSDPSNDNFKEFDPNNCRYYLPDEKICIY